MATSHSATPPSAAARGGQLPNVSSGVGPSSSSSASSSAVAPAASSSGADPRTAPGTAPSATNTQDIAKNSGDGSSSPTTTTKTLPARTKESLNDHLVSRFIARDILHLDAQHRNFQATSEALERTRNLVREYGAVRHEYKDWFPPSRLYGEGYRGFGNGFTDTGAAGPRLVYPQDKPRPGKRTTAAIKYSKKDMRRQAEQHEELVPIRIDFEHDKVRLRDTFTWNLHERVLSVDHFSRLLLEDLGVGVRDPLYPQVLESVSRQIHEQIQDFYPAVFSEEDALDPELPYSAYKNDEMRILVKLNITIGLVTLVDQFEWEINNPLNSPEEFANGMARDLSLSGEFATAIAHCIREQSQLFTKGLYSVGHPFDGRPVEDADLVAAFLPSPIPAVFRPQQQAKDYAPYLYEMTEADLERNEVIFSREQRRQKRSVNRRGGPQLPDLKERQRTVRTLVVSSVLPGAAQNIDESRLYKRPAGTGAGGPRRRGAGRDGDLSDSDDSDDSAPDSPSASQLAAANAGTARTRGLRGAASAAQHRMATLGRSETPEAAGTIHHETRTLRRFNPRDARDSTEESPALLVTLKLPRERLWRLLQDLKTRRPPPPAAQQASPLHPLQHTTSSGSQPSSSAGAAPVPARAPSAAMAPPPTTPSAAAQSTPAKPSTLPHGHIGRVPAPPPPKAGERAPTPPPPPEWLVSCLEALHKTYPNDVFSAIMRYCSLNRDTETVVPAPPADQPIPPDIIFMYLPRIRCHDCPGKLYTPGPDTTVGNFEVHLKNRQHRERVDLRVGKSTSRASSNSVPNPTRAPTAPSTSPSAPSTSGSAS